jgi:calcineurin-like phosphoesterase family protein
MNVERRNNMILLSSDWHLIKYKDGVEIIDKDTLDIVLKQLDSAKETDQFIFLGDMFDAEIFPQQYDEILSELKKRISRFYKPIFIRGNNDTQSDSFYKNYLGFSKVEFAAKLRINQKNILLSHTSVQLSEYKHKIDYNIHGHIHRLNTNPDTIPYYHFCDDNINLCTADRRELRLTSINDIDFEKESKRNSTFITDKREKAGMSQFIQNKVYDFMNLDL